MNTLLYFAIWAVVFFLMMRFGCGSHVMGHGHGEEKIEGSTSDGLRWIPPATDVDPVCGKTVRTDASKSSVHDGTVYYFCSRDCREIFEAAPEQYIGSPGESLNPQLEHSHV